MKVYKYRLADLNSLRDYIEIKSKEVFRPLSVDMQGRDLVIWALVDDTQPDDTSYLFRLAGTGHPVMNENSPDRAIMDIIMGPDSIHQFIGTVKPMTDPDLVIHVFFLGEGQVR